MSEYLMTSQQIELYRRLQGFSFDRSNAPFPFSQRLAKENGWSLGYAWRVIEEYKKFAFLAVVAGHPVSPSAQVDQVWHLHLTYTRSYWQEFCPKVLQMPLHHEPTRGGVSEQLKFEGLYSKTLLSYKRFFGQVPPSDIWPPPKIRFGRDSHFVWVNTQHNWVVPKPFLPTVKPPQVAILPLLLTLVFIVAGCQWRAKIPNPLNFAGWEFLTFYILALVVVIYLALLLRNILRLPNGAPIQQPVHLDVYETAYLAVGATRVVETAITSLVQQGYVTVHSAQRMLVLSKPIEQLSHPVEKALTIAIASDGRIEKVRQEIAALGAITAISERLRQLGLLVSQRQSFIAQLYPGLMITALLGLGIAKIVVGISRDKPVGYLTMLCVFIAFIGWFFFSVPPHRSLRGDRVLKNLCAQTRWQSLTSSSPSESQLPLVFALFGTTVLTDSAFAELKKVFTPSSSSSVGNGGDSGCGSGDGGGGSGCGSGGCGGCGGGGGGG